MPQAKTNKSAGTGTAEAGAIVGTEIVWVVKAFGNIEEEETPWAVLLAPPSASAVVEKVRPMTVWLV